MSSCVITKIAAATCDIFCSVFETDITSVFIRSSRLSLERSFGACCARVGTASEIKIATAAMERHFRSPRCRPTNRRLPAMAADEMLAKSKVHLPLT